MKLKICLFIITAFLLILPSSLKARALDDVRSDILQENRDEIKSINEEILRQKRLKKEEKARKKKAFQERIERSQRLKAIQKQNEIISESQELLETLAEKTKFVSKKRRRYEELINIYAEKPINKMSLEEQEETANQFLSSATTELIELLKLKKIHDEKLAKGEKVQEIVADRELLIQLNQYMQLVKHIEKHKSVQPEKIASQQESIVRSTQEFIELLKQEAIRRAGIKALARKEAEEVKTQLKQFEGTIGIHYGYDNNVNADAAFEGGLFLRNYFSYNWVPTLNRYLKAELGTWHLADNHTDDKDITFRIAAGQTNLKWYPTGDKDFLIQPGFEWSDTHYPNDATLATKENKLFINARHGFWGNWSQELNYEDSRINSNNNKLARDGEENDRINAALKKHKHSIEYGLNLPFLYNSKLKVKQKGALQTSNDSYLDYYDYNGHKSTVEIGRTLTQKLYAKAAFSYEKKNYTERTVTEHDLAQEDSIYTQKVSLFYFFNENWLASYIFSNSKVDSNSPVYDYEKMTHLLGVYYTF